MLERASNFILQSKFSPMCPPQSHLFNYEITCLLTCSLYECSCNTAQLTTKYNIRNPSVYKLYLDIASLP